MSHDSASEGGSPLDDDDLSHVFVEFADMNGLSRSKQVAADHFRSRIEAGFSMNLAHVTQTPRSDVVEGSKYGAPVEWADGTLYPDLDTLRRVPWREDAARVICEFEFEGTPVEGVPRRALRRVVDDATARGFDPTVGNELEFYLLEPAEGGYEPVTNDKHENLTRAAEAMAPFYDRVYDWAPAFGLDPTAAHHEFGAGQFEIAFEPGPPVEQADRTFRFKELVKQAADVDGHEATFMAKPFTDRSGSGYHLHVSLFEDGANVLEAAEGSATGASGELSRRGEHFVGGLVEHAPALTALGTPNLNGYKRHQPGTFAPHSVSWGYGTRMASIRVPAHGTTRIENRIPSADANPYLVVASTLAAGLHGIEAEIDPPAPSTGETADDRPALPSTPHDALDALARDDALAERLGPSLVSEYVLQKRQEVDEFYEETTDWERRRYVDVL